MSDSHDTPIVLMGDGRSGTTWLANLINHDSGLRVLFEPLHPSSGVAWAESIYWRYLPPEADDPALRERFAALFRGEASNEWIDKVTAPGAPPRDRVLLKEIRLGFLAGWLARQFPRASLVYLMRHPCAVIGSWAASGWIDKLDENSAHLPTMLAQPALMADHLAPHEAAIRQARGRVQVAASLWSVRQVVALRSLAGQAAVVFYEQVYTEPETVMPDLLARVGQPYDADSVMRVWRTPSEMTRTSSPLTGGADMLTAWRNELSAGEIDEVLTTIARFGLDAIYSDAPLPNPAGAAQF